MSGAEVVVMVGVVTARSEKAALQPLNGATWSAARELRRGGNSGSCRQLLGSVAEWSLWYLLVMRTTRIFGFAKAEDVPDTSSRLVGCGGID